MDRRQLIKRTFPILMLLSLGHCAYGMAENCIDHVVRSTKPIGDLRLCEYVRDGRAQSFACEQFQTVDGRYHMLFRGGRAPIAVYFEKLGAEGQPLPRSLVDGVS